MSPSQARCLVRVVPATSHHGDVARRLHKEALLTFRVENGRVYVSLCVCVRPKLVTVYQSYLQFVAYLGGGASLLL